jgi:hypothetical protein
VALQRDRPATVLARNRSVRRRAAQGHRCRLWTGRGRGRARPWNGRLRRVRAQRRPNRPHRHAGRVRGDHPAARRRQGLGGRDGGRGRVSRRGGREPRLGHHRSPRPSGRAPVGRRARLRRPAVAAPGAAGTRLGARAARAGAGPGVGAGRGPTGGAARGRDAACTAAGGAGRAGIAARGAAGAERGACRRPRGGSGAGSRGSADRGRRRPRRSPQRGGRGDSGRREDARAAAEVGAPPSASGSVLGTSVAGGRAPRSRSARRGASRPTPSAGSPRPRP